MEYKKLDERDMKFLSDVCGSRIFFGDEINEDYSHDEMPEYGRFMPDALVEPVTSEEISRIMEYADKNMIAVTPRGSGTGLCGGCVPLHGGILLSLAKMNKILEIDEDNLTVCVQPGVLLMDLAEAVASRGLMYPPDPGEKSATIGGNVMTNAGGMRAVKYGVTRDYVMGMTAVMPGGGIMTFGGKVAKNSSGYSLKDLIIGSEGTLCVVTELILSLVPAPQKAISLLVPFESLDACVETVPKIIKARLMPTAIEFLQREVIELGEMYLGKPFPDKSADSYLLMTFDGDIGEYETAAKICLEAGAADVLISDTEERQDSIWKPRGAFLEAIKASTNAMDECDVVVPRDRIAEFIKYTSTIQKKYDIRIRSFGHAGDGNIHVYACRDDLPEDVWQEKLTLVMDDLYEQAVLYGGQVSGEHGIGHGKRDYLKKSLGPEAIRLMEGVKKVFDPNNILNPGKVVLDENKEYLAGRSKHTAEKTVQNGAASGKRSKRDSRKN